MLLNQELNQQQLQHNSAKQNDNILTMYLSTEKDPERLSELSLQFYQALEEANLLGKNCKRRPLILKTVFKLLDLESPKLLLRLARLILAVSVIISDNKLYCI